MSIAQKKLFLVKPEGSIPPDWPAGWPFPPHASTPPGFPFENKHDTRLVFEFLPAVDGAITVIVRCVDEYNDPTDELKGYFISVTAKDGDKLIRMTQDKDNLFSKIALFQIDEITEGVFGINEFLTFDVEQMKSDTLTVEISLFGVLPMKRESQAWKVK